MSELTLPPHPPPRYSPEAPTVGDGLRLDSNSGDGGSDASVALERSSSRKGESSGDGDGKMDNKQRRKRTSPKDQAMLEAEYKQNPKPNKAARAEIVKKVDLNEKEVQIWFQNRRQIHRRKARPLLPHEIAAFGLGGMMAGMSSDPVFIPASSSSQEELAMGSQHEGIVSSQESNTTGSQELQEPLESQHIEEHIGVAKSGSEEVTEKENAIPSLPSHIPTLTRQPSSGASATEASSFSVDSVIKSFSSTPGYLANRWNAANSSMSSPAASQIAPFLTPSISNPIHPASCPGRLGVVDNSTPSSSRVLMSMSLDGKAELISAEPSPPRERALRPSSSGSVIPQKRMRGLQRSQSAVLFGPFSGKSSNIAPLPPRLTTGRSRDARSWQFACDAEARDELTMQAENESSGSAVAAISLLRSTSKSALKPNSNKRNAPSANLDPSLQGKKPKLGRAMSSLPRLQSTGKETSSRSQSSKDKDRLMHSPSGDSDKENWIPSGEAGNARRRPLPSGRTDRSQHSKSVLEDNFNPPTQSRNQGSGMNKRRKAANVEPNIFEDLENPKEVGEEVEKFMRGEISPSKKGDLDCVQGLLSLSKGNWR